MSDEEADDRQTQRVEYTNRIRTYEDWQARVLAVIVLIALIIYLVKRWI